ncbi:hypothetical protein NEOLEDRAFT_1239968 [Neolentinus lepideus HHB14362 ss-1]|uniref:Uncharacterized protein n=1 Tax=Neolentinus lepideus HHB14362 ss-1 TaxID=1314782 RepID=A0A165U8W2_9AGAM|nr:hypothetical protein NEOLEDRAFT_1239968 [Neolentinus lepideus HHB14362 ss-1]
MEDPWGNAWGEPGKPAVYGTSTVSNWTAPPATSTGHGDSEADLGAPSWSTGDDIKWAEPSTVQSFLWSQGEDALAWGSNPYADLPIGKADPTEHSLPSPVTPREDDESSISRASSPLTPVQTFGSECPQSAVLSQKSPITTQSPAASPPATPDVFGTFETGLVADDQLGSGELDPWSPASGTFVAEQSAWSSAGVEKPEDDEGKQMDEWEAAKREKEEREKRVPPEVVAQILEECEKIVRDVGPDESVLLKTESSESWQSGLEGVPGLEALMKDLLPDNAPPFVPFKNSAIAKEMLNSVRMTRNARAAHISPMSYFTSSSKGSMVWEASVKLRASPAPDVDVPAGWKVLEKRASLTQPVTVEERPKKGGLLSFLSRRASAQPNPADLMPSRPSTPASEPRTSSSASDARRSTDNVKPDMSSTPGEVLPPITSPPASSSSVLTPVVTRVTTPTLTAIISSTPKQPELPIVPDDQPTSAPSAVSRFFNRFSRTKSSSPRNSMALSSDDIDFLSDLVPSASDDHEDDDDPQLKALSKMLQSKPLDVPARLPPPLAPPPMPASRPPSVMSANRSLSPVPTTQPSPGGLRQSGQAAFEELSPIAPVRTSTPPVASTSQFVARTTSPLSSSSYGLETEFFGKPFGLPPLPPPRETAPMSQVRSPIPILAPPPSSSRASTPATSDLFTLPPPPSSQPYIPASIAATQPSSSIADPFDDDDFSDFHGPSVLQSSRPIAATSLYDSSFSSASDNQLYSTPERPLRPPHSVSHPNFDDFDDFVSSPIRSPSPPRPPAKPPVPTKLPASKSSPHIRKPSTIDHLATLNLVERAAARSGQWPAPPSPLPNALPPPPPPPPPNGMIKPSLSLDILDEEDLPLKPPDNRSTLVASTSSPARVGLLPPPPVSTNILRPISPPSSFNRPKPATSLLNLSSFDSSPAITTPANPSPAPSVTAANGKAGLSAQDLSFFEGL